MPARRSSPGAEINRQTRVLDMQARPDGSWDVITERGTVHAEHVVNAAGLWAREVGRMVGLELPVLAMEHQYLITEDLPEFAGQKEQLHVSISRARSTCARSAAACCWAPMSGRRAVVAAHHALGFRPGSPANDLERIAPSLEVGLRAFSAARQCRHPQGGERPVHLRSGWQSAARPGARADQLLGGLRRHGRLQPGRRCRTGTGALDGRWRSRRRHLGHGRGALR